MELNINERVEYAAKVISRENLEHAKSIWTAIYERLKEKKKAQT